MCVCVCRSMKGQVCALEPQKRGVAWIREVWAGRGGLLWQQGWGGGVPGDSEIVEMLIVHFQSSIKFNSHSASTCYSNSVTEYTSGMYSYSSVFPLPLPLPLSPFFSFIMTPHPPFTTPPLSPPPSPCHHWQGEGDCVNTIDDLEHMCASLWRPTNTWSSDSLSIHLFFPLLPSPPLSFFTPVSPLLISSCPNSSPSKFPLHFFPSSSSPRSFPAVYLCCRSLPMQCV